MTGYGHTWVGENCKYNIFLINQLAMLRECMGQSRKEKEKEDVNLEQMPNDTSQNPQKRDTNYYPLYVLSTFHFSLLFGLSQNTVQLICLIQYDHARSGTQMVKIQISKNLIYHYHICLPHSKVKNICKNVWNSSMDTAPCLYIFYSCCS